LISRPQCLQHGDFHNENLLISGSALYIIDWETDDFSHYADPWVDFAGIGSADVVPSFTSGQIHGYFDGEPSADFWRVFALYLSVGALLTLVWAHYRQRDCLEYGIKHANEISKWFDHMRNPVPSWYLTYGVDTCI
jgi:aminoglycoside phosphotransferase (APT) family kinase protein